MATTRWLTVVLAVALAVGASEASAGSGKPAEPDEAALVKGNNEFTFDLYARLHARNGNVFFSSFSISNALAMTYAGARGLTAAQMSTVLHFPIDGDRLHQTFAKVNRDVKDAGSKGGAELQVANALWIQMGFATLPAFLATIKNATEPASPPSISGPRRRWRGRRSMPGSNSRRRIGSWISSPKACSIPTLG